MPAGWASEPASAYAEYLTTRLRAPAPSPRKPSVPETAREPFQYALWRVVPRLERGECMNAGVVLYCRTRGFLSARVALDRSRLWALAPDADPAAIERHLATLALIAEGDRAGGAGGRARQSERFHRLVAPASTVVEPSPVHTGLSVEPIDTLERLFARLVA